MHYGANDNLIMPGRAKNMGDGWETRRRRGFKLSMREYEDLGLKVGDKVVIELKKPEITGI